MNYQVNYDPNGGDLGRANLRPIQALEFMIIAPHIADMLEGLHVSGNSRLPYKYAFEFTYHSKEEVIIVMNQLKLPPHVKFYDCDGQRLFEIRGQSGGVVSGFVCYLITGD